VTELLITAILNGFTIGLVYALLAIGLTIVMGLMGVVNFAHGSFYMIGGYIAYTIATSLGLFWPGCIFAILACVIVGWVVYFLLIKPLKDRPHLEPLVVLVGVAMIFRQLIRAIWGADPKLIPIPYGTFHLNIFGLSITYPVYFVIVMLISAVTLVLIYLMTRKTDVGIRCLAAIQDRDMALSMGVNVDRISILMFSIAMATAGVAGWLIGPIFSVYPTMGIELIGLLFVIVIVGGLGSVPGAVIGAMTIAMIKSVSGVFFSGSISEILAYCVLLVILIIRPRGIMGLASVME